MVLTKIDQWMFLFFVFCIIGWVQESIIESLYNKKPINRGFLKGPYIPIYGFGGILMILVCCPFKDNLFMVFFAGMLACTTLEFFVGWLMERIFNKRFWDYSMMKFTYKNRISLIASIFWGLLSVFMVYVLYGFISTFALALDESIMNGFNFVMLVSMGTDSIIQATKLLHFEKLISRLSYEQVKQLLSDKRLQLGEPIRRTKLYIRRRIDSYTNFNGYSDYDDFDNKDDD